ncbi:MAG TPA: hypothetical protein VK986_21590 [Tepidisphaeraceae bacterium]|nr:hypothetical protein [Tepidisphaeraceae bacterium]
MGNQPNDLAAQILALAADRARHVEHLAAIDRALAAVGRALADMAGQKAATVIRKARRNPRGRDRRR